MSDNIEMDVSDLKAIIDWYEENDCANYETWRFFYNTFKEVGRRKRTF